MCKVLGPVPGTLQTLQCPGPRCLCTDLVMSMRLNSRQHIRGDTHSTQPPAHTPYPGHGEAECDAWDSGSHLVTMRPDPGCPGGGGYTAGQNWALRRKKGQSCWGGNLHVPSPRSPWDPASLIFNSMMPVPTPHPKKQGGGDKVTLSSKRQLPWDKGTMTKQRGRRAAGLQFYTEDFG